MQVEITYLPAEDGMPPEIETLSTPWESKWDRNKCKFKCAKGEIETVADRKHLWLLDIEHIPGTTEWNQKRGEFVPTGTPVSYRVLCYNCKTFAEYVEWLESSVLMIVVDGKIYWSNPQYSEESGKDAE